MPLSAGARVGAYEVIAKLGEGGMGEVYRARDTRLKRDVALKILPPSVARDRDRVARFEREAELLAALNHPNIAHIHGVEDADGSLALVMELVEGDDLAACLTRGPIPVAEALRIAEQVAGALEAAHERGIIHRDLKPANIKVRPDGTVKVLDFGLAKTDASARAGSHISADGTDNTADVGPGFSRAATSPALTAQHMILGTAAYMSPEQARGRPVDRRADIWAFGAVLFEMLTGKRPFDGSDVTDTIASVLRSDPDWRLLPADVPDPVGMLIRRCLEKDPQRRPSHLSVATFLLAGGADTAASTPRPVAPATAPLGRAKLIAASVSTLIVGAAVASAITWWLVSRERPTATMPSVRFTLEVATGGETWRNLTDRPFVMAPDGHAVVYRALDGNQRRLVIRSLDSLEPRVLVENATFVRLPFFSPDSQWIAFFNGTQLQKVRASGGPAVTISKINGGVSSGFLGASWGDDDSIVFAVGQRAREQAGLLVVPASGGEPKALTTVHPERGEGAQDYPFVLPGSRGVLFRQQVAGRAAPSDGRLMVLDRASGEQREIVPAASAAEFTAGRIVFADRQGRLHSLPFDLSQLQPTGPVTPLAERTHVAAVGQPMFSTAISGALAFLPALDGASPEMGRSLVWVNRQGQEEPFATPRAYAAVRLSPDARRIALDIRDEGSDIWVWSVDRGTLERLTSDLAFDMAPIWTPDGRRIVWSSTRESSTPTMYVQAADGTGAPQRMTSGSIAFPGSVTPDGQSVLFSGGGTLILRMPLDGRQNSERLLGPIEGLFTPEVSPDGRWLAYQSNESGQPEVFVRPYPNLDGGRWQISTQHGSRPAWSRNGRELFFLDGSDHLSAASITINGSTLVPGAPQRLLSTAYYPGYTTRGANIRGYDVSPDGQRFLMIKGTADATVAQSVLTVVANWRAVP